MDAQCLLFILHLFLSISSKQTLWGRITRSQKRTEVFNSVLRKGRSSSAENVRRRRRCVDGQGWNNKSGERTVYPYVNPNLNPNFLCAVTKKSGLSSHEWPSPTCGYVFLGDAVSWRSSQLPPNAAYHQRGQVCLFAVAEFSCLFILVLWPRG